MYFQKKIRISKILHQHIQRSKYVDLSLVGTIFGDSPPKVTVLYLTYHCIITCTTSPLFGSYANCPTYQQHSYHTQFQLISLCTTIYMDVAQIRKTAKIVKKTNA